MKRKFIAMLIAVPVALGSVFVSLPAHADEVTGGAMPVNASIEVEPEITEVLSVDPVEQVPELPVPEIDEPSSEGESPVADEEPGSADIPTGVPSEAPPVDPNQEVAEDAGVGPRKEPERPSGVADDKHLVWWPATSPGSVPPFWIASSARQGEQLAECATVDDPLVVSLAERLDSGGQADTSFNLIQFDTRQSTGTVVFDVPGSMCGQRWGVTGAEPVTLWDPSDAAFTSISNGVITLDLDIWNTLRAATDTRAVAVLFERPDGSVVSVGLNVSRQVTVWSCFAGPPAPFDEPYSDVPATPDGWSGSISVGETLSLSLEDLAQHTGWPEMYLTDVPEGFQIDSHVGPVTWTPTEPGIYEFSYMFGSTNCASSWVTGTVAVFGAATPPVIVVPQPEMPILPVDRQPEQVMEASQLANTGSIASMILPAGLALLALGVITVVVGCATRRSRGEL